MEKTASADVEAEEVFNTAMSYLAAYRFLSRMIQPMTNPAQTLASAMPIMSMCALVIELEMKVFHVLDHGRIPRSHDLADLYRNLAMTSRIAINKAWKSELPKRRAMYSKMEEHVGGKVKYDLVEALESGRRGFEKFRYSFEQGDDADDDFMLHQLPELLRGVLIERQPGWASWTPRPPKWLNGTPVTTK